MQSTTSDSLDFPIAMPPNIVKLDLAIDPMKEEERLGPFSLEALILESINPPIMERPGGR